MKTTTYKDVLEVNSILNKCINKGLAVESILKLIDFKDELQEAIEKYQRVFKEIMAEYDIAEENGIFNWANNEKVDEISDKVTDLIGAEVKLQHANFLEDVEIVKVTENMPISELSYVRKFLKK